MEPENGGGTGLRPITEGPVADRLRACGCQNKYYKISRWDYLYETIGEFPVVFILTASSCE